MCPATWIKHDGSESKPSLAYNPAENVLSFTGHFTSPSTEYPVVRVSLICFFVLFRLTRAPAVYLPFRLVVPGLLMPFACGHYFLGPLMFATLLTMIWILDFFCHVFTMLQPCLRHVRTVHQIDFFSFVTRTFQRLLLHLSFSITYDVEFLSALLPDLQPLMAVFHLLGLASTQQIETSFGNHPNLQIQGTGHHALTRNLTGQFSTAL